MANWIQTYSGKKFFPLEPVIDDIIIEDIAAALSHKCRFNGHCLQFYSWAEHCYFVSRIVADLARNEKVSKDDTEALAKQALFFDAPRAYLPDAPWVGYEAEPGATIEHRLRFMIFAKADIGM